MSGDDSWQQEDSQTRDDSRTQEGAQSGTTRRDQDRRADERTQQRGQERGGREHAGRHSSRTGHQQAPAQQRGTGVSGGRTQGGEDLPGVPDIDEFLVGEEEISYVLSHRPKGLWNWIKSLLGWGMTYWYVTDDRVFEYQSVSGGFGIRDVALDKVSSLEYGRKLNLPLVAIGAVLGLFGLVMLIVGDSAAIGLLLGIVGVALVLYAYYRRQQVLAVHASGGVEFVLNISKGENVEEFLWYVQAQRRKQD